MKTTIKLLCGLLFIVTAHRSFAQNMEGFFRTKGVKDLCEAAHPSNQYLEGKYFVADDHVSISIVSEDNITGRNIYTDIQLRRGNGALPFTELILVRDTDPFKTFDAFLKLQVRPLMLLYKGILDEKLFGQAITTIESISSKKVEDWDGATWALLAINFDYYNYLLTGE